MPPTFAHAFARAKYMNSDDLEEIGMDRPPGKPAEGEVVGGASAANWQIMDYEFTAILLKAAADLSFNLYLIEGLPRPLMILGSYACFTYELAIALGYVHVGHVPQKSSRVQLTPRDTRLVP